MNAAWTNNGRIYRLLIDGQVRATIEPKHSEFLLVLHLSGGRTIYTFDTSVQKLMDHAEKELKVTA